MSRTSILWVSLLSLVGSPVLWAQAPAERAGQARERMLQRFDKNGDGQLSREERQAARQAFEQRRVAESRPAADQLPEGVTATRNLEYARVGDKPLLLDMYLPNEAKEPLPLVVWIHGGGWRAGSKERCPAIPLAAQGFAVASINYRLTDEATFPAQIHDCKGAIRWLRARADRSRIDPSRIGVWGSSAGGHLVALLGTSGDVKELEGDIAGHAGVSSRVQAVCDFCGPASFLPEDLDAQKEKNQGNVPQALTRLLGGPIEDNREKARLASPTAHVSKDDPPFLIVHGDKDTTVPMRQSERLAAALKEVGVDVTLRIVPGAGHGLNTPENIKLAAEFFTRHLKSRGGPDSTLTPVSTRPQAQ